MSTTINDLRLSELGLSGRNTMPQETSEEYQEKVSQEYLKGVRRFPHREEVLRPYCLGSRIHIDEKNGRPYQQIDGVRFYLPDEKTQKRFARFRKETHEAIHQQFYAALRDYNKDKITLKVFYLEKNPKTGKCNVIHPSMLGLPEKYYCFLRPNGAIVVTDRRTKRYVKGFHHNCLGPPLGKCTRQAGPSDLRQMMIDFLTMAAKDKGSRPVIVEAMMKTLARKPEKLLDLAARISPKEINNTNGDPAVIVIE